jgi:hypothetical protein
MHATAAAELVKGTFLTARHHTLFTLCSSGGGAISALTGVCYVCRAPISGSREPGVARLLVPYHIIGVTHLLFLKLLLLQNRVPLLN